MTYHQAMTILRYPLNYTDEELAEAMDYKRNDYVVWPWVIVALACWGIAEGYALCIW